MGFTEITEISDFDRVIVHESHQDLNGSLDKFGFHPDWLAIAEDLIK